MCTVPKKMFESEMSIHDQEYNYGEFLSDICISWVHAKIKTCLSDSNKVGEIGVHNDGIRCVCQRRGSKGH